MSNMNETWNRNKISVEAAIKQKELERLKSKQRVNDWINSSIARKRALNQSARAGSIFPWLSGKTVFYISVILAVNLFLCHSFYKSMFAPDPNYTSHYAKSGDFKRAEKFVNSFLSGNLSDRSWFKPEMAEAMSKNASGLLGKFTGASASSVVVSDMEDKGIVLKATCPCGGEAAVIYLTPSRKSFHVSGIEIKQSKIKGEL
ncbi:MAG: hypothetical protein WC637_13325 [Victivallales bacterium]|jgi:hypothetical protein